MNIHVYIYICMVTPPTTRTPLKDTVNTDTNANFFPNPILELFLQIGNTSVKHKTPKNQKSKIQKIQKSKNPKIQKSKDLNVQKSKHPKLQKQIARFRRCKKFWILIFLFLECWISGCLYSGSLDLNISAHQEQHFRVP